MQAGRCEIAFPYDHHVNFESGTRGSFDGETDTNSKLDFPHYSELARFPGHGAPFSGAYCMRVDLSGGTADAFVNENASWDFALNASTSFRFYLWVSDTIAMADADEFIVWALRSAAAYEAVVAINFTTANGLRIGVGKTAAAQFLPLTTNQWHLIDMSLEIDAGGGNDGSIAWRLDGVAGTTVSSLNQLATTTGRLGAMDIDAGTTAGVLLFDDIATDSERIFGILPQDRFSTDVLMVADGHAFVGPGCIDNLTLNASETADCAVRIYDTDVANSDGIENVKLILRNTGTTGGEIVDPAGVPITVKRGAYVTLAGTADALGPWARVKIGRAAAYGSDGAIRSYGLRRKGGTAI